VKRIFYGIAAISAAIAVIGIKKLFCSRGHSDTDCIDGGVVTRSSGDGSPKTVISQDIESFKLTVSTVTFQDESSPICGRVYRLCAELTDGKCKVTGDWRDRYGKSDKTERLCEGAFMRKLCDLITKHDLARHNGYYHHVSGLPDMYGAELDVRYASGEYITAADNQGCFMSLDAVEDFCDLFFD